MTGRQSFAPIHLTKNQPPTQNLSTIAEGLEHAAFGDIPELELHNQSTTTLPP
jgi:hypothetical protein